MRYIDLFNEIQLSRGYNLDKKTGVNWRYHVDDEAKRVYIEFQETKTDWKYWFYNLLVIPKTVKSTHSEKIKVPLGFYLQAKAACSYILADFYGTRGILLSSLYEWYFVGRSIGGAVAGISGFILGNMFGVKRHLIQYGTPSYCYNEKSLQTLCGNFSTVRNFLYEDDWIKPLVPFCKRPPSTNVQPKTPDEPKTLDQRHKVYGHCIYPIEEF